LNYSVVLSAHIFRSYYNAIITLSKIYHVDYRRIYHVAKNQVG
jgi:hypothetical protein